MPQLVYVNSSHDRWSWIFGKLHPGFWGAQRLLLQPGQYGAFFDRTWNSGRHAPGVTLTLGFDAPVNVLKLCPHMKPEEGLVGLIVVLEDSERIAHREVWRENEWVEIPLPKPSSEMRVEFMESPSWIALHAVDAS
jgi:hypothetical protein